MIKATVTTRLYTQETGKVEEYVNEAQYVGSLPQLGSTDSYHDTAGGWVSTRVELVEVEE